MMRSQLLSWVLVLLLYPLPSFFAAPLTLSTQDPQPSILFMLSSLAISGGNISILQEAIEMRRKGMLVSLAVSRKHVPADYVSLIMALSSAITTEGVRDMIIIYDGNCCWPKAPSSELVRLARSFDIVIATYHTTALALEVIVKDHPHLMPAYYVQDYEPWFTCNPFECPFRNKLTFYNRWLNKPLVTKEKHFKYTESTYSVVSGKVFLFAKTKWIKKMVEDNHKDTHVHLVTPSIDHTVYYPELDFLKMKAKVARMLPLKSLKSTPPGSIVGKIKIIAMLRPRTPRRNTLICLDTLLKLANEYPTLVQVSFFGVDRTQLTALVASLVEIRGMAPYRSSSMLRREGGEGTVKVLGLLKQRHDLAKLYRSSDLFVDMSWWQAFGRTAVEAMACGCVPIMPSVGAGSDVCEGGRVCQYHDGTDEVGYYAVVESLVQNHTERLRMMEAGLTRAGEYSIRQAASSIQAALRTGLTDFRRKNLVSL